MKTHFVTQLIIILVLLLSLVSCESHEQKTDVAFENFKEGKLSQKEDVAIPEDTSEKRAVIIKTPIKVQKTTEGENDWTKFKCEIEKKIIKNEIQINEIKAKANLTTKELKKASSLEKENNDIRRKMDEFKEDEKMKWEKFKLTIDQDVNDINVELKDINSTKTTI